MFFIAYSDSDVLGALTWAALHSLDTVYCACIALLFPIAISFSRKLSRSAGLVTCGAPAASVPTSTALASSFFTHYPAYIPSTATCNNTPTPEPVNILSQQHGGQRRLAARVLPAAATDSGAGATGRGVRRKEQKGRAHASNLYCLCTDCLSYSANSSADLATAKPFPFLRLPAELRNKIYGYVLTDNREERGFYIHHIDGSMSYFYEQIDRVILVNDVTRRIERRRIDQRYAERTEQYRARKGAGLSKKYHLLNKTGVMQSRLARNLYGSLPLRETSILAVCRQMHRESQHVLYSENTFGAIVSLDEQGRPFGSWFPSGIDISLIQHLRIEIQFGLHDYSQAHQPRAIRWSSFRRMTALTSLQIFATFQSIELAPFQAQVVHRCWASMEYYRSAMSGLIAAIPERVACVNWGLTKEEKERCDYAGFVPVKGCVLRKMYRTKGGAGEEKSDMQLRALADSRLLGYLPVNGDGDDSDEEDIAR